MGKSIRERKKADFELVLKELSSLPGMADVKLFEDKKDVNDYFFKGVYGGVPCICKFSSITVQSIRNEYELTRTLHSVIPDLCPKALLLHEFKSVDGSAVVTEFVSGMCMREACSNGVFEDCAVARMSVDDIFRILEAMDKLSIIHRDFHPGNLILGADGRLKLIDLQFSVRKDRQGRYREDSFLLKWFWSFLPVFGCITGVGVGRWNDIHAARMMLQLMPQYDFVRDFDRRLSVMEPTATLYVKPGLFMWLLFPFNKLVCRIRLLMHRFYRTKKQKKFKNRLALMESACIGWTKN